MKLEAINDPVGISDMTVRLGVTSKESPKLPFEKLTRRELCLLAFLAEMTKSDFLADEKARNTSALLGKSNARAGWLFSFWRRGEYED